MKDAPLSIVLVQPPGAPPADLPERLRALGYRLAARAADITTAAAMLGAERPDLAILCPADKPAEAAMAARGCWQSPILVLNAGADPRVGAIDAVIACSGADPSPEDLSEALSRASELRDRGNRLAKVIW